MIDGLKPYPEMRATGIEWLPALPVGWQMRRAKYSFSEVDDRSEAGGEELLSVSHKTGVTPRSQKNITMFMAETYEGHKICQPGDIVVNTMWAWMAAVGVSSHIGIVSPAYGIYRPRATSRFAPRFLDYLLRTEPYRAEYLRSSRGITTSRLRLYPPDFLDIPLVQPPLDEQKLIVRFLDWHGAQTSKLLRVKRNLIAMMNEQRHALVQRVTTRGLNPTVGFKASSVAWLQEIPVNWEVKRLKSVCRINPPKLSTQNSNLEDLLTFLPMECVSADGQIITNNQVRAIDASKGLTSFRKMDVLLAKITPCFENGKGAVLDTLPTEAGVGSTEFIVLRAGRMIDARYLYLITSGSQFRKLGVESMTGSAGQQRISYDFLANFPIAVPPLDEQVKITEVLRHLTHDYDIVIATAHRATALIQEFRTRLIADVVTGKLDVRAAAASLPALAEPDPADALIDDDDLDEAADTFEDEEVAA